MLLQHDAMRVCGFVTCAFFTWESLGLLLKACSHSIHAVLGPISCPRPMGAMGVSVCELFILLFYCFCIESTELTCYSTISLPIYIPVVLYMQTPHTHKQTYTQTDTHTDITTTCNHPHRPGDEAQVAIETKVNVLAPERMDGDGDGGGDGDGDSGGEGDGDGGGDGDGDGGGDGDGDGGGYDEV